MNVVGSKDYYYSESHMQKLLIWKVDFKFCFRQKLSFFPQGTEIIVIKNVFLIIALIFLVSSSVGFYNAVEITSLFAKKNAILSTQYILHYPKNTYLYVLHNKIYCRDKSLNKNKQQIPRQLQYHVTTCVRFSYLFYLNQRGMYLLACLCSQRN